MSSPSYEDHDWLKSELTKFGGNAANLARAYGWNERTVQRHAKQSRINDLVASAINIPHTIHSRTEIMKEIVVSGNGACTADWHVPLTRWDLVADMVETCIREDATDYLIIAGDFFNYDALSDYFPKQKDHSLYEEIVTGRKTLDYLSQVFDRIIVTKGNHDIRLQKALGYKLSFEDSLHSVLRVDIDDPDCNIEFTGRDYALVDSPTGIWRVCHTANYSRNQLAYPSKLADLHQQHVMGAHRHHHAVGFSPSGKRVIELGGFFDKDRTEYLVQWSKDFPLWQNGYVVLIDGIPLMPLLHA